MGVLGRRECRICPEEMIKRGTLVKEACFLLGAVEGYNHSFAKCSSKTDRTRK